MEHVPVSSPSSAIGGGGASASASASAPVLVPTAPAQFAEFSRREVPALDRVAPHLWSLPLSVPVGEGSGGVAYTLCYVLRDAAGRLHLVDPGWGTDDTMRELEQGLAAIGTGLDAVRSVIATHLHPDHLGGAQRVRDETGAPLLVHEAEQTAARRRYGDGFLQVSVFDRWGVPLDRRHEIERLADPTDEFAHLTADLLLRDGEGLAEVGIEAPGLDLGFLRTPGHTPGSLCIVDRIAGAILTGDHVLPHIYPGLGLGGPTTTNPIEDYLVSLEAVRVHDDLEVAPGHGYRFRGLAARCDQLAAHHRRRNAEVAVALDELGDDAPVWQVASRIRWSKGFENLHGFSLGSALAQTETHIELIHSARASAQN